MSGELRLKFISPVNLDTDNINFLLVEKHCFLIYTTGLTRHLLSIEGNYNTSVDKIVGL